MAKIRAWIGLAVIAIGVAIFVLGSRIAGVKDTVKMLREVLK